MNALTQDEVILELNHLFAEEVEAALRYLHLSNAIRGLDHLVVGPVLKRGYQETIEHAEVIAHKIRSLGAVPNLEVNISLGPEKIDGKQALELALTFEEAALEAYQDCLRRIEGDVPLEEFIRSQIVVESEHVAELKQLLVE
ncbi:MAG: ferritin-like domain-containing protein [Phycisphaerae bacterium]|nr:ferritin-like domain-containing protein [Phycisphaerae bacterium]